MASYRPILTRWEVYEYYRRGIIFGADGSLLPTIEGKVFCIGDFRTYSIDYWIGQRNRNGPYLGEYVCQMMEGKEYRYASELISLTGFASKQIGRLQGKWRGDRQRFETRFVRPCCKRRRFV